MNDSMLMQAKSRQAELTREAGQSRLAARTRRPRPTSRVTQPRPKPRPQPQPKLRAQTPSRPPRPGSWLATAIARLRPTDERGKMAGATTRSATVNDTVTTP